MNLCIILLLGHSLSHGKKGKSSPNNIHSSLGSSLSTTQSTLTTTRGSTITPVSMTTTYYTTTTTQTPSSYTQTRHSTTQTPTVLTSITNSNSINDTIQISQTGSYEISLNNSTNYLDSNSLIGIVVGSTVSLLIIVAFIYMKLRSQRQILPIPNIVYNDFELRNQNENNSETNDYEEPVPYIQDREYCEHEITDVEYELASDNMRGDGIVNQNYEIVY